MVQETILSSPTRDLQLPENQQQIVDKQKKMVVTDVELCCSIVLTFYRNYGKTWLTADDIFSFLNTHYVTTKQDVLKVLDILSDQYLITKSTKSKAIEYTWSIRSNENGLFHFVGK